MEGLTVQALASVSRPGTFGFSVDVTTDFNGTVRSSSDDVTSLDPGVDFYFTFPLAPDIGTSFYGGAWAAPTTSIDVDVQNYVSGTDYVTTSFEYHPNLFSAFVGLEQVLYEEATTKVFARLYGGGRLSSWEYTATGAGNGAINHSDSGNDVVPVGGVDLSIEWDHHPDGSALDGWTAGLYGGVQVQGGNEIETTFNTFVNHSIDVDPAVTGYFGLRVRYSF
jgi:hypothetical protein